MAFSVSAGTVEASLEVPWLAIDENGLDNFACGGVIGEPLRLWTGHVPPGPSPSGLQLPCRRKSDVPHKKSPRFRRTPRKAAARLGPAARSRSRCIRENYRYGAARSPTCRVCPGSERDNHL